jgi:hypothetical protein
LISWYLQQEVFSHVKYIFLADHCLSHDLFDQQSNNQVTLRLLCIRYIRALIRTNSPERDACDHFHATLEASPQLQIDGFQREEREGFLTDCRQLPLDLREKLGLCGILEVWDEPI